jgi:hypothetical protein
MDADMFDAVLSRHALHRSAQSNLSERDVALVQRYGFLQRRTGVRFYVMRRREVERHRAAEPRLARLEGVVMVMSQEGVVITLYRNSRALKEIRRKAKFNSRQAA